MTFLPRVVCVGIWVKIFPGLIGIHEIDLLWIIQVLWVHINSVTKYTTQSRDFVTRLGTTIKEGNLPSKLCQLCYHLIIILHLVDSKPSTPCTLLLGICPQHLVKLHYLLSCLFSHCTPCGIIDHVLTLGRQSIIEKLIL